jgi:hypothetical protein
MTEESHDPTFKTLNVSAEIKKEWGPEWNQPEVEYEFSNGKKFYRKTDQASIYSTSPDF